MQLSNTARVTLQVLVQLGSLCLRGRRRRGHSANPTQLISHNTEHTHNIASRRITATTPEVVHTRRTQPLPITTSTTQLPLLKATHSTHRDSYSIQNNSKSNQIAKHNKRILSTPQHTTHTHTIHAPRPSHPSTLHPFTSRPTFTRLPHMSLIHSSSTTSGRWSLAYSGLGSAVYCRTFRSSSTSITLTHLNSRRL